MMKPGIYYVGDLCYVLHDEWDEFCNLTINGISLLSGEFNLKDGRRFASYCTQYGDGTYKDYQGREYGVDAGLIGCILLSDIDLSNDENFIRCGNIVEFSGDFNTSESEGKITFGNVVIDTAADYNEEEDNE